MSPSQPEDMQRGQVASPARAVLQGVYRNLSLLKDCPEMGIPKGNRSQGTATVALILAVLSTSGC